MLFRSMSPLVEVPLETSPDVSLDIPSAITLGSTLVDPLSDYSSDNICDDAHVNLSSQDDESGSFATSDGISFTSHPILYYDDEIVEAITTPEFIYPRLHRTHAFEPHTPCGHYIDTQYLGKGAPIFERPGEETLHNSPSVSGHVDSSTLIITHLEFSATYLFKVL